MAGRGKRRPPLWGGRKGRVFLAWTSGYQKEWLRFDLLAGLTLWALLVPQAVAYARIAGAPAEAALLMVPLVLLIYAAIGGSHLLVVATNSAVAITSASTVNALAGGDAARFATLTVALALLVGCLLLLLGLLRTGFLADFMARPVVTGFLFGLALIIALDQLPSLLGIPPREGRFFPKLVGLIGDLPQLRPWSTGIGLVALALLLSLGRWTPRFPASLLVVVLGIGVVWGFGLQERGIAVVGEIPAIRFRPALPTVSLRELLALLPGAIGVAFLGLGESISAARVIAAHGGREVGANREMVSLGAANLAAGLVGGFAVSGSVSASQANERAGARSPLSTVIAALLVFLTAAFATTTFRALPVAVLAAIVIQAVLPLMRVRKLVGIAKVVRTDFILALIACVGVLVLHVLTGLLLAILLSIAWLLYRTSQPHAAALGEVEGEAGFDSLDRHPGARPIPGLLIFRLDAPLFFANAGLMHRQVIHLLGRYGARAVVLDMELSFRLDSSSLEMLDELREELRRRSSPIYLARAHAPVRQALERSGFLDRLDPRHLFNTIQEAVEHFQQVEARR